MQAGFMAGLFLPFLPSADVIGQKIWLSAIVLGVFFCGWICPFGAAQEWLYFIAHKLKIKQYKIPEKFQKYLQFSRYIFYVLSVFGISFSFLNARYYFDHNLAMNMLSVFSAIVLTIFLLLSIFIRRPFCNYFCIKGAVDGAMSVARPLSIARDDAKCIHCHLCNNSCPMNILVEHTSFVRHPNCINCFKCVDVCPKKCLKYKLMKFNINKDKGEKNESIVG